MGALTSLISGPPKPKAPTPPPPPPLVSSADASARDQRAELRKKRGLSSTVLTSGLGRSSNRQATGTGGGATGTGTPMQTSTLLGGGSRPS